MKVSEIMSHPVITAREDGTLEEVARIMLDHALRLNLRRRENEFNGWALPRCQAEVPSSFLAAEESLRPVFDTVHNGLHGNGPDHAPQSGSRSGCKR